MCASYLFPRSCFLPEIGSLSVVQHSLFINICSSSSILRRLSVVSRSAVFPSLAILQLQHGADCQTRAKRSHIKAGTPPAKASAQSNSLAHGDAFKGWRRDKELWASPRHHQELFQHDDHSTSKHGYCTAATSQLRKFHALIFCSLTDSSLLVGWLYTIS